MPDSFIEGFPILFQDCSDSKTVSYKVCINALDLGENTGIACLISLENVVFIKSCILEVILDYGDI
jgi:hypothetical protein